MKKTLFTLVTFLIMFTSIIQAQWVTNAKATTLADGQFLAFDLTVDSVQTYTSNVFSLNQYDNQTFYTYPLNYQKLITSAAGTPYVTATIQGSFTTAFTSASVVDTILLVDSVETVGRGVLNLNDWKFPYYRLSIIGATNGAGTKNRADTVLKLWIYANFKD